MPDRINVELWHIELQSVIMWHYVLPSEHHKCKSKGFENKKPSYTDPDYTDPEASNNFNQVGKKRKGWASPS